MIAKRFLFSLFALNTDSSNHPLSTSSSRGVATATAVAGRRGQGQGAAVVVVDSAEENGAQFPPRSNATHLVWKTKTKTKNSTVLLAMTASDQDQESPSKTETPFLRSTTSRRQLAEKTVLQYEYQYHVQTIRDAQQECLEYLQDNIMAFDRPFQHTMGFPSSSSSSDADNIEIDGLESGLIGPTIALALQTKIEYPWTDTLPKAIFLEYVLNYANVNEGRTNWRPMLTDALHFNATDLYREHKSELTIASIVQWVNTHLWSVVPGASNTHPILFQGGQTPLIMDPMSILVYGYASCTGTSILLVNALRAVGIAARVVGTPAWWGIPTKGNHNWVEVYTGETTTTKEEEATITTTTTNTDTTAETDTGTDPWKFLEPSPGNVPDKDHLDKDPCSRWFCQPSRYPASQVYAARLTKQKNHQINGDKKNNNDEQDHNNHGRVSSYFPLAWELDNYDVPGVDRTEYYTEICSKCQE